VIAGAAGAGAGCDLGTQHDEPHFGSGAPVHLVAANIGKGKTLAPGERIELFFDRLLLQESITRQTFVLSDLSGNTPGTPPTLQYDPVARVVILYPQTPLMECQSYRVTMVTPQSATDANGIRAIDGATLDPSVNPVVEFEVTCNGDAGADGGGGAGTPAPPIPSVDFCSQITLILSKCNGATCHGGALPAAGLRLDSAKAIASTAIGRVAQGANTGARATAQPGSLLFGQDMPIVQAGTPGNSWMMFKLLMAVPPNCSSTAMAAPCDASAPEVMNNVHTEPWGDMGESERGTLANMVQGREMPFPANPGQEPGQGVAPEALTLDELELVNDWILEGAPVNACQ